MSTRLYILIIYALIPVTGMGMDIYAPSLPALKDFFGTTETFVQVSLSIFILGFSLGQLVFGPASDAFGRRPLLLFGVGLFIVSSLAATRAPSIEILIALRTLQGFSIASVSAITKAIISDSFDDVTLEKHAAYMTSAWALGPIAAPMIGGLIQTYFDWHVSFYFLALYTSVFLGLAMIYLPETRLQQPPAQFKQVRHNAKRVLSHATFRGVIAGCALSFTLMIVFQMSGPFIIQDILGYSPKKFGEIALMLGVIYFLGTLSTPRLRRRFPSNTVMAGACLLFLASALGCVCLALFPRYLSLWTLTTTCAISFYALGIYFPMCLGQGMRLFRDIAGMASAILGFGVNMLVTLLTLILSTSPYNALIDIAASYAILAFACTGLFWFHFRAVFFKAKP